MSSNAANRSFISTAITALSISSTNLQKIISLRTSAFHSIVVSQTRRTSFYSKFAGDISAWKNLTKATRSSAVKTTYYIQSTYMKIYKNSASSNMRLENGISMH